MRTAGADMIPAQEIVRSLLAEHNLKLLHLFSNDVSLDLNYLSLYYWRNNSEDSLIRRFFATPPFESVYGNSCNMFDENRKTRRISTKAVPRHS